MALAIGPAIPCCDLHIDPEQIQAREKRKFSEDTGILFDRCCLSRMGFFFENVMTAIYTSEWGINFSKLHSAGLDPRTCFHSHQSVSMLGTTALCLLQLSTVQWCQPFPPRPDLANRPNQSCIAIFLQVHCTALRWRDASYAPSCAQTEF